MYPKFIEANQSTYIVQYLCTSPSPKIYFGNSFIKTKQKKILSIEVLLQDFHILTKYQIINHDSSYMVIQRFHNFASSHHQISSKRG